jgi:hypothetical protein
MPQYSRHNNNNNNNNNNKYYVDYYQVNVIYHEEYRKENTQINQKL